MSGRRGEVPFVASRVGRSNDPREVLGLARDLRVERATALGYVTLWEEFILEVGDALTGRVKGYDADHVAEKLGWRGKPARLLEALRRAGVLATQRGVFLHPYWHASTTGHYARTRAELREAWRAKKAAQRAEDVSEMSPGQVGDVPGESRPKEHIDQSINGGPGAAPPPAPPGTGGSLGAARWEWLLRNHERPMNPVACTKYLAALTEEEWRLCQWVVGFQRTPPPFQLSRKKRVLALDAYKFIASRAFLQFQPEWGRKLEQDRRAAAPPVPGAKPKLAAVPPPDDGARREASALAFLLAQLADPDLDDGEKEAAKARWVKLRPGTTPPWESAPAAPLAAPAAPTGAQEAAPAP